MHERALIIKYQDYATSFTDLVLKDQKSWYSIRNNEDILSKLKIISLIITNICHFGKKQQ